MRVFDSGPSRSSPSSSESLIFLARSSALVIGTICLVLKALGLEHVLGTGEVKEPRWEPPLMPFVSTVVLEATFAVGVAETVILWCQALARLPRTGNRVASKTCLRKGHTRFFFFICMFSLLSHVDAAKLRPWRQVPFNAWNDGRAPAREAHGAVGMPDGSLFIFGGYIEGVPQNDLFMVDVDTGEWFKLKVSGSIPQARYGLAMAAVGTKIVVNGGYRSGTGGGDGTIVLDTNTMEWQPVDGTGPDHAFGHKMVAIGAHIYLCNLFKERNNEPETVWQLDSLTWVWHAMDAEVVGTGPVIESPFTSASGYSMTAVGDSFYVFVGSDFWMFSTATMKWGKLDAAAGVQGTPPSARSGHESAAVGTDIFLHGQTNEVFRFATVSKVWQPLDTVGDTPPATIWHTVTAVGNQIYIFGGRAECNEGGFGCVSPGERGDVFRLTAAAAATMECTMLTSAAQVIGTPPPRRTEHTMTAVGAEIFVLGGKGDFNVMNGKRTNELWSFSLETHEWKKPVTTGTPPPFVEDGFDGAAPRFSIATVDTDIFVLGDGELFRYLTLTKAWQKLQDPAITESPAQIAAVSGNLFLCAHDLQQFQQREPSVLTTFYRSNAPTADMTLNWNQVGTAGDAGCGPMVVVGADIWMVVSCLHCGRKSSFFS
jgi:hypothetical protein